MGNTVGHMEGERDIGGVVRAVGSKGLITGARGGGELKNSKKKKKGTMHLTGTSHRKFPKRTQGPRGLHGPISHKNLTRGKHRKGRNNYVKPS